MNGFLKLSVLGLAAMSLAACAGMDKGIASKQLPSGSSYQDMLSKGEYVLSTDEYNEGDYKDSDHFAMKSMAAGRGEMIEPDTIASRHLPGDKVAELTAARQRLTTAIGKGAPKAAPKDTAEAFVMFDCWIQEQEENWTFQQQQIMACKEGFLTAMAKVDAAMKPAPAPVAMGPAGYQVFFDFDKSNLTPQARDIVDTAAAAAMKAPGTRVQVVGHTDTAGPASYNLGLSKRRAESVKKQMEAKGVAGNVITTDGVGEAGLLVPTGDGVPEPQNRRAVITLKKPGS